MRPIGRIAALIAVTTGLACDVASDRPDAAAADSTIAADRGASGPMSDSIPLIPLADYIEEGAFAHGLTRAQLIERFGAPAAVRAQPVPNRHDPSVTDSVVELEYEDASYVYYVVTQGPGEILDAAQISTNEHLRHPSPGIGTSARALENVYGPPARSEEGAVEYECVTCEVAEPVRFVIDDGRVTRVEFDYYVD